VRIIKAVKSLVQYWLFPEYFDFEKLQKIAFATDFNRF